MPDKKQFLSESFRVLKPGGLYIDRFTKYRMKCKTLISFMSFERFKI